MDHQQLLNKVRALLSKINTPKEQKFDVKGDCIDFEFRVYNCPKCDASFVTLHMASRHMHNMCMVTELGPLTQLNYTKDLLKMDPVLLRELHQIENDSICRTFNKVRHPFATFDQETQTDLKKAGSGMATQTEKQEEMIEPAFDGLLHVLSDCGFHVNTNFINLPMVPRTAVTDRLVNEQQGKEYSQQQSVEPSKRREVSSRELFVHQKPPTNLLEKQRNDDFATMTGSVKPEPLDDYWEQQASVVGVAGDPTASRPVSWLLAQPVPHSPLQYMPREEIPDTPASPDPPNPPLLRKVKVEVEEEERQPLPSAPPFKKARLTASNFVDETAQFEATPFDYPARMPQPREADNVGDGHNYGPWRFDTIRPKRKELSPDRSRNSYNRHSLQPLSDYLRREREELISEQKKLL